MSKALMANPTSALRYYEELGLIPAPVRVSDQRRYPKSAVGLVGMILLLRDVGFSLCESKTFLGPRTQAVDSWRIWRRPTHTDLPRIAWWRLRYLPDRCHGE
jgi:DNA-binding transcriptional MerR regulator